MASPYNQRITAGANDAHETQAGTNFSGVANTILMNSNTLIGNRYIGGFRFTALDIPNAATILTATITIQCITFANDDPNVEIYCEDVDDAVSFVTDADVQLRPRTAASTPWVATGIGVGAVVSPDFTAALQEVIDRGGWASGADLVVLIYGNADVFKSFTVHSFEGNAAFAAMLDVSWAAGAPSPIPFPLAYERKQFYPTFAPMQ